MQLKPSEWDELPWYEQYVYLDGFAREGLLQLDGHGTAAPAESAEQQRSAGYVQRSVTVPAVDWLDGISEPSK